MDGVVLVNKEKNMTSRDVVNIVCKSLNTKKVGHTGTLDPLATGVLVILVGKYLKLSSEITSFYKVYEAEITLGIDTDTLDITGKVLKKESTNVTNNQIDKVLESFRGKYDMEVPKFSAVKVNGRKLYEYARNNEEVILPIRQVEIRSLKRISDIKNNKFKIECEVSKGTYIRSLVRDISRKLNTIGVMSELKRLKQGNFDIKLCQNIDEIKNNKIKMFDYNILDIPKIEIDDKLYKRISNGSKLDNIYNLNKICFIYNNNILALYIEDENDKSKIKPKRVFK